MRILLHVGMPKAGSTALQQALARGRERLGQQGILYPRAPLFPDNQNFLVAGVEERRHALPRMIRSAYEGRLDELAPAFARWMADIRSSVASARPAPETMVLSSEWLFGLRGQQKFDRLADLLRGFGSPVEVVAYVRRPAEQYLSAVQQTLKGSHAIRPVTAVRYRTPLEGFARVADTMRVVRYDRAAFPGGDIVRHFLETFLPDADLAEGHGGGGTANATISAEGMAILAGYRRVNHRKSRGRFTPDTDRLIAAIRDADGAIGGAVRPRLRPEVASAVDAASGDVLWLRDTHGIVFDGLDYDRVGEAPTEAEPVAGSDGKKPRPKAIEEICIVDPERHQELLMRVLHGLATTTRTLPAARLRGVSLWLRGREARVRR